MRCSVLVLSALVCLAHAAPQSLSKRTIWDRPLHPAMVRGGADNDHMRQEGGVAGLTPPMQHKNLQRPVLTANLHDGANDVLAGVPDSTTLDFPEDITFAAPCEDMVEDTPTPLPSPSPKPESVVATPDYKFAKQVVSAIKEVCKRCGCKLCQSLNLTDTNSLVFEVYALLPTVPNQTDVCPKWLAANPNWPSLNMTATTKMEEKIKTKAEQKADGMMYPMLKLTNSSDRAERSKYDVAKRDTEEKKEAEAEATEKTAFVYSVPKQPVVPDDCADDMTGSGGLSNVEVAGAATGMNTGYAEARQKAHSLPAARPTRRRGYLDSVASLLETSTASSPCVEYEGMFLVGEQPLYEPKKVEAVAECIEACLFDEDCTGWTVNSSLCALYDSDHPNLSRPPHAARPVHVPVSQSKVNLVSGLCPKAHVCPASIYQRAVQELTSAAGVGADCPALLARLTTSRGPTVSRCQCLHSIKLPTDDCFLSANTVTLADLHSDCRKVSHGRSGLIQVDEDEMGRMPDCAWTDVFSAGMGSCKTYSMDADRSNHVHCTTDFDVDFKLTAVSACWQCGKCAPTPSPSAIIPPPELITSETLPNGDKTPCLSARQATIKKMGTGPGQGAFIPQCFKDGTYMPTQCVGKYCWCVYTNGVEIPDTRRIDTPEEKMTHCRPAPPMEPVYPAPAVIMPNPSMLASRTLAKMIYSLVESERICRRNRTTHLEDSIYSLLVKPGNFSHVVKSNNTDCPAPLVSYPNHAGITSRYPVGHVLAHLVSCLVPPPVAPKGVGTFKLPSESPVPSPTPSLSASPSLTATASPSSPVVMCGDVACKDLGLRVHMHQSVPPGFCATCLDGTSGPCRSKATYGCYQYVHGTTCRSGDIRCADLDNAHHKGVRFQSDCPDYIEGTPKIDMSITLDTPFIKNWIPTWGRTFSSALADVKLNPNVTEVQDLCGLTVFDVEAVPSGTQVHVRITEKDLVGMSPLGMTLSGIRLAVDDGSLLKALNRRGVPAQRLSDLIIKVTEGKKPETTPDNSERAQGYITRLNDKEAARKAGMTIE